MAQGPDKSQDCVEEWFQRFVTSLVEESNYALDDKFVCSNCLGLAYLPHKTKCDHLFCTQCIKLLKANGRKCFVDNTVLRSQDIDISLPLKSEILNMNMSCPYKAHGCLKFINVWTAWDHVKECAQTYAIIDCPWKCGCRVQIKELKSHFTTDCHCDPEKSLDFSPNMAQMHLQSKKPAANEQSRPSKRSPVVDMFKTPQSALQSKSPTSRTSRNKTVTFRWPILHYFEEKQRQMAGRVHFLESKLFAHPDLAHQFKIRVHLNGTGYGRDTHVSLFIVVCRGYEKSASFVRPHKLTVKILNQNRPSNEIQLDLKKSLMYDASKSAVQESFDKTIFEFYGFRKFAEQVKVQHTDYLQNDTLIFEVVKEFINTPL